MTILSLATAKEYVLGYYETQTDVAKADIEGCGLFTPPGYGLQCGLNVNVTYANGVIECLRWDVWEEDDGCGGYVLRGEA